MQRLIILLAAANSRIQWRPPGWPGRVL